MSAVVNAELTPVDLLPGEAREAPEEGIALCLSGGGYRAMLFHLGAIWRLAELGFLGASNQIAKNPDGSIRPVGVLKRISSVSGGSLTAGVLGLNWNRLEVDQPGLVDRYVKHVVIPIRTLAGVTLAGKDRRGVIRILLDVVLPGTINEHIITAYKKYLYGDATLQDLPDSPRFVINASNLQSGALWRFMKPYIRDWRVGEIKNPTTFLAQAVAASSAFPPFLAPASLTFSDGDYTPNTGGKGGNNLQHKPFTTNPTLADGGVYDNLGLETAFKRYQTLLVSNAGAPFNSVEKVHSDWARIGARCIDVMDNQVLSLRKRLLIANLQSGLRHGAFWDIQQDIAVHRCVGALPCSPTLTRVLSAMPTDLAAKDDATQERLINWGYAVCDAAVRGRLNASLEAPSRFPYARGIE